ncbi:MAG: D-aminoacyl-tRNA deacylase [Polyangiaceae bacterium]|nr:D-aminoacyl-tRNA deacylase [Polyangiaceae bacterium]
MRAVVQRCRSARVEVDGTVVGAIGPGLCTFLGAGKGDDDATAFALLEKILRLRIFPDERGKMSLSLLDCQGELLLVSQFTLYGDTRKGRRPSFEGALAPALAEPLLDRTVAFVRSLGVKVETGRFGADMRVFVENDGPVTLPLASPGDTWP